MSTAQDGWALAEACLRLAWYCEKFGPIPEDQQRRLMRVTMSRMFRRPLDEQDQELLNLSKDLMAYLREAHQNSAT